MKYCQKCGNEILEEAVICPKCGCSACYDYTAIKKMENEGNSLAVLAVIFAFLFPLVGFILGIIGTCKYKKQKNRNLCIMAMIIPFALPILFWCFFLFCGFLSALVS